MGPPSFWCTWVRRVACAVVGALALFPTSAVGHGYMTDPAARHVQRAGSLAGYSLRDSTAAGGGGLVYDNGKKWPNGRHGLCGESYKKVPNYFFGPGDLSEGGKYATPPIIAATYAPGATIKIRIAIFAWHRGRFEFKLCKDPARSLTQACFDEHPLTDPKTGSPFFFPSGADDQAPPNNEYIIEAKLPAGVSCSRCVLQWYWLSGNSCVPPGDPRGPNDPLGSCGGTGSNPEEFWNCADISIGGKDASPPSGKITSQATETVKTKTKTKTKTRM